MQRTQPCPDRLLRALALTGALAVTPLLVAGAPAGDDDEPAITELRGIVRDFRERTVTNGHPDFERRPEHGFGHYSGNVAPMLGDDRKPVYTGGGFKLRSQFYDSIGRPICYTLYSSESGDVAGDIGAADDGGIESAASFAQWFSDVPGVNSSLPLTLKFQRQSDGTYVFDDKLDDAYADLAGFFPIEHQLFGNPGGSPDRNFHFTFELHTEFVYEAGADQVFRFVGDDDVWVFINDQLVIDLGGVHGATDQVVEVDRLGLEDGTSYPLDFFFAERHRTQSNFRCETNLVLTPVDLPAVTAAFD